MPGSHKKNKSESDSLFEENANLHCFAYEIPASAGMTGLAVVMSVDFSSGKPE
jgi:hypothetical protein